MERKFLFWISLSGVCLVGALWSWQVGDQWEAERVARRAAVHPVAAGAAGRAPARAPAFAPAVTHGAGATVVAKVKGLFPYRLANTGASVNELVHNEKAILLANALLDTGKALDWSAIPERLKAGINGGSYIVQAKGPLDDSFRSLLKGAGATIVSYIPNNAYLVRVSDAGAQTIAAQAQSVLPYEPYYKLDAPLLKLALEQPAELPVNGVRVTLFPDAETATRASLEQLGAIVVGEDKSPFGPVLAVEPAPGTLSAVAGLPGVQLVTALHRRVHANDLLRPTLGAATDSLTTTNYLGLSGSNVLININDDGVDATHPDLAGRLFDDGRGNLTDPSGHGTHVAGTILGTGAESTTVSPVPPGSATNAGTSTAGPFVFRGVAPNARGLVLSFNEPDAYLQETAARTNLAVTGSATNTMISNNSWNYAGDAGYDIAAASYDAAVRDALPEATGSQPIVYVFSAGNDGGAANNGTSGDADTILSPATAKNVITVGAVEQNRMLTNTSSANGVTNEPFLGDSDSSDQVAAFSSRGNVGVSVEGTAGRFKPDLVAPGTFVISDRSGQWDTMAYYNPTNESDSFLPNRIAPSNSLDTLPPLAIDANDVRIVVIVSTNRFSPVPFPPLPIYATISPDDNITLPTTNSTILGTNTATFPNPTLAALLAGQSLRIGIGNLTNPPIHYDVTIEVFTTNDTGFFIGLSNLNNSLGTTNGGFYRYESGTSMAAAGVSGMLACLQEFFNSHTFLTYSPALLKALLINGANPLDDYDLQVNTGLNSQGWGVPSLTNSLPFALSNLTAGNRNTMPLVFVDQNLTNVLATGQSNSYNFQITPDGQNQDLRITLVWTDPPGNPVAGTKLVNDLDLIVSNNVTGDVFYGNDIAAGNIYNNLGDTNAPNIDSVNNVENVFIQEPVDTNFTVTVLARRVNVNAVTLNHTGIVQDYALVISSVANPGQPGVASPFTGFAPVTTALSLPTAPVTNVIVVSNATPLFNQRVGGNSQYAGSTNGTVGQWNFYVFTNTAITDVTLTNAASFTNLAFVTFTPPSLAVPRMEASGEQVSPDPGVTRFAGADVDLYVSADPSLTNLNPAAINAAFKSTSRTGTEKVLLTDAPSLVYYLAVKSEDQEGAQYDLLATAVNQPFDQEDGNHNVTVTMLTPFPIVIPPGGPANPSHALVLGVTTASTQVRKVVVTNEVTHQEFGDLIGTLTHESAKPESAVLNNHTFFPNNNLTNFLVYDDSGENDTPGSKTSDGPGTLNNFVGDTASDGIWRFVMVNDNSTSTTGSIINFVIFLEPQPNLGGFRETIQPDSFFFDFVDVPANATNLTITVTPDAGSPTEPLSLFVRQGDFPSQSLFDFTTSIPVGGGSLTINKFSNPPLNAGRYFFGIFNPNSTAETVFITVQVGLSVAPEGPGIFTSIGNEPILDDAVTDSTNFVNATSLVSSAEVGVRIEHPRESDLVLTLISPEGTRVLLAENRGGLDTNGYGSGINLTNVLPRSASGNNAASTNNIAVTNTAGTLLISFDFEMLPDDLRVYYGGSRIYDTGLISGTGTISVDYGPGNATNLEILMNEPGTNPDTNGDVWSYTASVVTKSVTYAVFSENTNLATVPIKFATPPFGGSTNSIGAANVFNLGFEGAVATTYLNGATVDGWTVEATNGVALAATNTARVVTVPQFADSGTNVLALHSAAITRVLPTIAGRSYTLVFANHGRPVEAPVSWWKAEGDASDSADGNEGQLENGASFVPGEVGRTFSFNGVNQYVMVPDSPNLRFTTAMSVEAWVFPTDETSTHAIVSKYDGVSGNQTAFGLELNSGGQAFFSLNPVGIDTTPLYGLVETPHPLPLNQWSYLAGTYNGSSIDIYVNGALVSSLGYNRSIFPGSTPLAIGANIGGENAALTSGGSPDPFQGFIDEPTVYNTALSIKQVQDIYAAGSAGKCPVTGGGGCTVTATVFLDNNFRVIAGSDAWTSNTFTFTAQTNGTVLTIAPDTNFDGTVQDGNLVDSFTLIQNPTPNPTNYFLPEESLAKLTGERAQGDWKLEILDNRAGATNPPPLLVSWQLSLQLSDVIPFSIPLLHALPQTNTVAANSIVYYAVDVPPWAKFATNSIIANGPINLLFNQVTPPSGTNAGDLSLLTGVASGTKTLSASGGNPLLEPGQRYFLGVQNTGASAVTFTIEVDFDITTLTNNVPVTSTIAPTDVPRYFQFDVLSNSIVALFQMINPSAGVTMVVKKGPPLPDLAVHDYEVTGTTSQSIPVLTNSVPVPLAPGRWYVGVFNTSPNVPVTYTVEASQAGTPVIIRLTNDVPFTNFSTPGPALTTFYVFTITNTNSSALFELYGLSGNVDLTLQREALPYGEPFFGLSANGGRTNEQIVIRTNVLGTNINGNWFLGVPNNDTTNVTYTIHAVVSTNGLLPTQVPIQPVIKVPPVGSPVGPTLVIPTVAGDTYEIEESTSPVGPFTVIATIVASGQFTTYTAPPPTGPSEFYRVVHIPGP